MLVNRAFLVELKDIVVEELEIYLKDTLGEHVVVRKLMETDMRNIPMFIAYDYSFYKTKLFERDIILMSTPEESRSTTSQYKKHVEIAEKAFGCLVVLVIPKIKSDNRLRLIEKKVNFIVPGTQLYLPDMLIDLREVASTRIRKGEFIKPSTQVLLLYHLLIEKLENLNFKSIAEKLSYSSVSVTYAVNELLAHGICSIEGKKNKHIVFDKTKRELWDMVEPLMTSPVLKTVYTDEDLPLDRFCISGIKALSHFTDIAPERQDYYAISNQEYPSLNLKHSNETEGKYGIEVWKYNPLLLAKDNYVDPLSLYLIFRKDTDVRVESELEKLIETALW